MNNQLENPYQPSSEEVIKAEEMNKAMINEEQEKVNKLPRLLRYDVSKQYEEERKDSKAENIMTEEQKIMSRKREYGMRE